MNPIIEVNTKIPSIIRDTVVRKSILIKKLSIETIFLFFEM